MSSILFVQSAPSYGSFTAQEALDAVLMGSAFTECALLFLGVGVLQLIPAQSPEALPAKNFTASYGALKDYGVTRVYCESAAIEQYNLDVSDLIIEAEVIDAAKIRMLLSEFDTVLNF